MPTKAAHPSKTPVASRLQAVGLVVLDVANPFFAEVARGAGDAASARSVVILCNSDGSTDAEASYLDILRDQGVPGVVVSPAGERLDKLRALQQRGMCVVLLDRASETDDMCSVAVDNVKGGMYVGRHLITSGHQQILFIGSRGARQVADRRAGLCAAVVETGLNSSDVVTEMTIDALTAQAGQQAAARLLRQDELPTAIFCANDLVAFGLLQALHAAGVDVPGEVCVVGYDDVLFAEALSVPLTTVRQPKYGLGQAAMSLLLDEVHNGARHRHQQKMFAPQLMVRASSDLSAVAE